MTPTITAFKESPDRGQGLARDMRIRWALEEVGQSYELRFLTFSELKQPAYKNLQPFGQIPVYEEGELVLFETGSIVLHIASKHSGLLPEDKNARARAITWMFCALNTIEPPIIERSFSVLVERDKSWYEERLIGQNQRVHARLGDLSARLGGNEWLEGSFSADDLIVIHVIRRLVGTGLLEYYPNCLPT